MSSDFEYSNDSEVSSDEFTTTPKTTRTKKGKYDWKSDAFVPKVHQFDSSDVGLKIDVDHENMEEIDFFKIFVNTDFVNNIVKSTNKNYDSIKNNFSRDEKNMKWTDTNLDEIYAFLGISMLLSRNSQSIIGDNWTTDVLFFSPIYSHIMPRNRFRMLIRMLYFCENQVPETEALKPMEDIIKSLQKSFSEALKPNQNICIENSHTLFKGRSSLHSQIPNKRFHFGIKLFTIRDCATGFILNFALNNFSKTYAQKTKIRNFDFSGDIVMTLCSPYLELGHTVFLDIWYSNPTLFNTLHKHKTNVCGISRRSKLKLPKLNRELKKGDSLVYYTDAVMAHTWIQKREITMLSTLHLPDFHISETRSRSTKEQERIPLSALDYQKNVDKINESQMIIASIDSIRKTIQCYKKVFFHLIDLCLYNGYVIYQQKTGKTTSLTDFQEIVINQLIAKHKKIVVTGKRKFIELPAPVTDRHFLGNILSSKGTITRRRCIVCCKSNNERKVRKESRYMCKQCNVTLCAVPCFEYYHVKKLKLSNNTVQI